MPIQKQFKLGIWPKTRAKVKAIEKVTSLTHSVIADKALDALAEKLGINVPNQEASGVKRSRSGNAAA